MLSLVKYTHTYHYKLSFKVSYTAALNPKKLFSFSLENSSDFSIEFILLSTKFDFIL